MILVDTHVVVWLAFDQAQLSKKARVTINDARLTGEGLAISDVTLLELAKRSRTKGASASTSASNRSCAKSRRGSSSCRSAALPACACSNFRRPIRRIQRTASSAPPPWWKECPCLLRTARSGARGQFTRSGDEALRAPRLRIGGGNQVSCLLPALREGKRICTRSTPLAVSKGC